MPNKERTPEECDSLLQRYESLFVLLLGLGIGFTVASLVTIYGTRTPIVVPVDIEGEPKKATPVTPAEELETEQQKDFEDSILEQYGQTPKAKADGTSTDEYGPLLESNPYAEPEEKETEEFTPPPFDDSEFAPPSPSDDLGFIEERNGKFEFIPVQGFTKKELAHLVHKKTYEEFSRRLRQGEYVHPALEASAAYSAILEREPVRDSRNAKR